MGVHQLPQLEDYRSHENLLGVPGIVEGMPIDRFKVILQCLHVKNLEVTQHMTACTKFALYLSLQKTFSTGVQFP